MAASVVERETGELEQAEERVDVARVDPRFIQVRQGRPFVTYPGLLSLLHQLSEGFFSVETLVVQLPTAENAHTAVCTARVRIFDPQEADVVRRETSGIGDADPTNVSTQMRGHLLRMAETRAKARALRDAVNVGMAALEELGPEEPTVTVTAGSILTSAAPVAPVEGIVVEGRRFSRQQVEGAWKQRRAEAERLGIALPGEVASLVAEQAPLAVLVGATQQLRKMLEATQAGQR